MKKKINKVEKKNNRKSTRKVGLPPGTAVYTGSKDLNKKVSIECITYNATSYSSKELKTGEDFNMKKDTITWINVDGIHNVETIKKIAAKIELDTLIIEDIVSVNQRPKIEERKNYFYLILKTMKVKDAIIEGGLKKIEIEQVSFIIGENYVLTFQENEGCLFKAVKERLINNIGKIREKGNDYLAYELIDLLVDNYFLVVEGIEEELDLFEEKLLVSADKNDLEKIIKTKKEFFKVKRNITLANDIVGKLHNMGEMQLFGNDMKYYIQDLHDHTIRLNDLLDNLSVIVHSLVEIYHSAQNKQINDVMKIFTIITTIFVPISFITGFYGMNIEGIPLLDSFTAVFTIMLVVVIGMIMFFKTKRWI